MCPTSPSPSKMQMQPSHLNQIFFMDYPFHTHARFSEKLKVFTP